MEATTTVIGVLVVMICAASAFLVVSRERTRSERDAKLRTQELLERLEQQATNLDLRDERLTRREETLEAKARTLELRDANLLDRERIIAAEAAEFEDALIAHRKRMEEVAEYTAEEARHALIAGVEEEARRDALVLVRDMENRAREEAERRAREIIATAVQRVAVETSGALSVSLVTLPDDDMKGRIIGRDGRNIRAFEQITGVNLVVDDTPESVLLSCFNPIRREIARLTLSGLITDGRIHPAAIEAEHKRATARVGEQVLRAGQDAVEEARVSGLHPDLIRLLGELHFRTSYGQNVLRHCVETAHIGGSIAEELGMSPDLVRRCGLLHDVGKALTHQVSGSHAAVGAEVARRLGEPMVVCHAVEAHHGEIELRSIEAVLTQAADAISAARPGARRDAHEQYITRLRRIEQLCGSHEGVERVYAMQAGRDVRVMVRPEIVSDEAARALAAELAGHIEAELQYPGQIAITVVREVRATEIAH